MSVRINFVGEYRNAKCSNSVARIPSSGASSSSSGQGIRQM